MAERIEDIEPNVDFELERLATARGENVRFNSEARQHYFKFVTSAVLEFTLEGKPTTEEYVAVDHLKRSF